jgi:1-deoxy-D-xylulose-5-phosphate synthase
LAQQAHHHLQGIQYHHIHYPLISENPITAQIQSDQNNSTSNISWTQYEQIITVEDGCIQGGWGQKMASALSQITRSSFIHLGIPNEFIEHGNNEEDLYPLCGYSPGQIAQSVLNAAAKNSH